MSAEALRKDPIMVVPQAGGEIRVFLAKAGDFYVLDVLPFKRDADGEMRPGKGVSLVNADPQALLDEFAAAGNEMGPLKLKAPQVAKED